jgi:hypothetical protein
VEAVEVNSAPYQVPSRASSRLLCHGPRRQSYDQQTSAQPTSGYSHLISVPTLSLAPGFNRVARAQTTSPKPLKRFFPALARNRVLVASLTRIPKLQAIWSGRCEILASGLRGPSSLRNLLRAYAPPRCGSSTSESGLNTRMGLSPFPSIGRRTVTSRAHSSGPNAQFQCNAI